MQFVFYLYAFGIWLPGHPGTLVSGHPRRTVELTHWRLADSPLEKKFQKFSLVHGTSHEISILNYVCTDTCYRVSGTALKGAGHPGVWYCRAN